MTMRRQEYFFRIEIFSSVPRYMFCQAVYLEVLSNCFFNNFVKGPACMFTELPRVGMVTIGHLDEILCNSHEFKAAVKVRISHSTINTWLSTEDTVSFVHAMPIT